MAETRNGLKRIGVFYDGNYLYHVNNYYRYEHERRSRLSIKGLHDFIRYKLSELEKTEMGLCHIVDAHYFRGRLNAEDARDQHRLYQERQMDDLLMEEGVVTHYLPLKSRNNRYEEKGIDVWLALEAYELTTYKEFNIVVLVASDGDYVPLIRKLNTRGARVMVLSWDFEYTTSSGKQMVTRTSQALLEEVAYPIAMHETIDNRVKRNDPMVRELFAHEPAANNYYNHQRKMETAIPMDENGVPRRVRSRILSVLNGFGFIEYPPNNLFFHHTDVMGGYEFGDLHEGDKVRFTVGTNDKGEKVARNVELVIEDDYDDEEEHYDHEAENEELYEEYDEYGE